MLRELAHVGPALRVDPAQRIGGSASAPAALRSRARPALYPLATAPVPAAREIRSNMPMDSTRTTDQRLTDLEVKASFTEDLLDQLNLTIYQQQQQIDRLVQQVGQLRQQMPEGGGAARNLRDELPPHY